MKTIRLKKSVVVGGVQGVRVGDVFRVSDHLGAELIGMGCAEEAENSQSPIANSQPESPSEVIRTKDPVVENRDPVPESQAGIPEPGPTRPAVKGGRRGGGSRGPRS